METLKIIGILLVLEILILYLFTVIVKYRNGEISADIWNIFYSWRNADLQKSWLEGYKCHEKLIRKEFDTGVSVDKKSLKSDDRKEDYNKKR